MNSTDCVCPEGRGVMGYTDLIINCITLLVTAWTSYKLGHFYFKASNVKCCGEICCDEFIIDVSESEEESRSRG